MSATLLDTFIKVSGRKMIRCAALLSILSFSNELKAMLFEHEC